MEWIEGQSLDQIWGNGLPVLQVVDLGCKLANALAYLHTEGQETIHRDIKPQNIMIRENGEPVLIDFGIARAAKRVETIHSYDEQGHPHSFNGSLRYAAPEQMKNPLLVTNQADIYALGLVLYEALTGGKDLSWHLDAEKPPDARIPGPLWRLLCAMRSKDPYDRPDARQLYQDLEQCLDKLKNR